MPKTSPTRLHITPIVGCDVVDVARLASKLARTPGLRERLFTDRELADACRGDAPLGGELANARLAARFAAKEATRKALGDLKLSFHASEVRTGPSGAPQLWLDGRPADLALSLSHDAGIALAVVVGLTHEPQPSRPTDRGDLRATG